MSTDDEQIECVVPEAEQTALATGTTNDVDLERGDNPLSFVPSPRIVNLRKALGMNVTPLSPLEVETRKQEFLRAFTEIGYTTKSCRAVGISYDQFTDWLERDPEFKTVFTEIDQLHTESIREEIRRRAVDGVEQDIYFQGNVVGSKIVYSDILLIHESKRRDPLYRDRAIIENNNDIKLYNNLDDNKI